MILNVSVTNDFIFFFVSWHVNIHGLFKAKTIPSKAEELSPALLFTHSWRENNWIHKFPKGIRAMWNAISLVKDLNSCRRVHFLRRYHEPLHSHGDSIPDIKGLISIDFPEKVQL